MTKNAVVKKVKEKTGLKLEDARKVLESVLETVVEAVAEGKKVKLVGFGAFVPVHRKPRKGINPRDVKQEILIPEKIVPGFHSGKGFKEKVMASMVDEAKGKKTKKRKAK